MLGTWNRSMWRVVSILQLIRSLISSIEHPVFLFLHFAEVDKIAAVKTEGFEK
jgi:hypothetical protein